MEPDKNSIDPVYCSPFAMLHVRCGCLHGAHDHLTITAAVRYRGESVSHSTHYGSIDRDGR